MIAACSAVTVTPCVPPCLWQIEKVTVSFLMAGGKVSNRISAPKFSKVVVAFIPNEAPRWPTTCDVIKKMVDVYAADARKYERLGEWAERIGWERFFEKCELEFTHHLIDDFRDPAYFTWRQTSQFKF
jgi:dissimilatory sulfite reductase beta subunit